LFETAGAGLIKDMKVEFSALREFYELNMAPYELTGA
jgi:hypothetical protein